MASTDKASVATAEQSGIGVFHRSLLGLFILALFVSVSQREIWEAAIFALGAEDILSRTGLYEKIWRRIS